MTLWKWFFTCGVLSVYYIGYVYFINSETVIWQKQTHLCLLRHTSRHHRLGNATLHFSRRQLPRLLANKHTYKFVSIKRWFSNETDLVMFEFCNQTNESGVGMLNSCLFIWKTTLDLTSHEVHLKLNWKWDMCSEDFNLLDPNFG